jgi:hypothetical protein
VLNQCALVLEGVTLAEMVQFVIEMLVDLATGTVLHEKTAEDTESAHPYDLAESMTCQYLFLAYRPRAKLLAPQFNIQM